MRSGERQKGGVADSWGLIFRSFFRCFFGVVFGHVLEGFGRPFGSHFRSIFITFSDKNIVDFSIDFSLIFGWMTGSAGRAGRFGERGFAR